MSNAALLVVNPNFLTNVGKFKNIISTIAGFYKERLC